MADDIHPDDFVVPQDENLPSLTIVTRELPAVYVPEAAKTIANSLLTAYNRSGDGGQDEKLAQNIWSTSRCIFVEDLHYPLATDGAAKANEVERDKARFVMESSAVDLVDLSGVDEHVDHILDCVKAIASENPDAVLSLAAKPK